MVGRVVARLLALAALIAVGVAIYLVVHATVDKNHHTMSQTKSAHHHKGHHHKHGTKKMFYVVQPGDTLSGIAVKEHIPLTRLEALNPNISENALQTGTKLRLRK